MTHRVYIAQRTYVKCMQGIGDNIFIRPFVRLLAEQGHDIYLHSVLPEMYQDLPVKFLDPGQADYRTQQKNFQRTQVKFTEPPESYEREIKVFYGPREMRQRNIMANMEMFFGFKVGSTDFKLDLPSTLPHHGIMGLPKKVAIVRPVTHRAEWLNTARSPLPNYIGWCARILRDAGYYVISLADTKEKEEWIDGEEPPADMKLHHGELGLFRTLSLFRDAKIVVTGPNFAVPAALAAGANLFTIFGGRGGYDNPHKIFDPRMNLKKIGWAIPDNFCRCYSMEHDCNKKISKLDADFYNFLRNVE